MSHSIIINGRLVPGPHGKGLVAQHIAEHTGTEEAAIEYTITYRPDHSLGLAEQQKRVKRLQSLAAKIEKVVDGGEEE